MAIEPTENIFFDDHIEKSVYFHGKYPHEAWMVMGDQIECVWRKPKDYILYKIKDGYQYVGDFGVRKSNTEFYLYISSVNKEDNTDFLLSCHKVVYEEDLGDFAAYFIGEEQFNTIPDRGPVVIGRSNDYAIIGFVDDTDFDNEGISLIPWKFGESSTDTSLVTEIHVKLASGNDVIVSDFTYKPARLSWYSTEIYTPSWYGMYPRNIGPDSIALLALNSSEYSSSASVTPDICFIASSGGTTYNSNVITLRVDENQGKLFIFIHHYVKSLPSNSRYGSFMRFSETVGSSYENLEYLYAQLRLANPGSASTTGVKAYRFRFNSSTDRFALDAENINIPTYWGAPADIFTIGGDPSSIYVDGAYNVVQSGSNYRYYGDIVYKTDYNRDSFGSVDHAYDSDLHNGISVDTISRLHKGVSYREFSGFSFHTSSSISEFAKSYTLPQVDYIFPSIDPPIRSDARLAYQSYGFQRRLEYVPRYCYNYQDSSSYRLVGFTRNYKYDEEYNVIEDYFIPSIFDTGTISYVKPGFNPTGAHF